MKRKVFPPFGNTDETSGLTMSTSIEYTGQKDGILSTKTFS